MSLLSDFGARLHALFFRKEEDRELDEELAFHLEMAERENLRRGMSAGEARRQAAVRLGGETQVREATRDARGLRALEDVLLDLRYGVRSLLKAPGFALAAVLILALGIGANTAIFSVVDATLLRPPEHVRAPEHVVKVYTSDFSGPAFGTSSYPDYIDFRARVDAFSALAAFAQRRLTMAGRDDAEVVTAELVTGNYFQLLGVSPAVGRLFVPAEGEVPGRDAVVVLSHGLWRRSFGGDSAVIGRTIRVSGQPLAVVGVAPEGFAGPTGRAPADLWVPIGMESALLSPSGPGGRLEARGARWLEIVGRLAPAATAEAAAFQLSAVAQSLFEQHPDAWGDMREAPRSVAVLSSAQAWVPPAARGGVVGFLALVSGLVALVLMIACANVGNLLLARAMRRRREIAVRVALGASRRRIVQQLFTENFLLAALGGVAGTLLAVWATAMARRLDGLLPIPLSLDLQVDARVLGFALLVSLATALVFGLVPAVQAARRDPVPTLKDEGGTESRRGGTLRGALVAAQVAICAVLLVCAALLVQSLRNASSTDLGFDPEGVLLIPLQSGTNRAAEAADAFHAELQERVAALPGVDRVALAEIVPLSGSYQRTTVAPDGYTPRAGEDMEIDYNVVSPGYFEMLEIPLVRGRALTEGDREGAPPVAVVNESFAAHFWPGENAVGKRFGLGDPDAAAMEVVGITRDGKLRALGEDPRPAFWMPLGQAAPDRVTLHVETRRDPAVLLASVRGELRALDPDLPVTDALPFEAGVAAQLLPLRLASTLFAGFGLLAIVIAMVGLYGVLAYAVSRRAREFGIRIALGARGDQIVRGVVKEGVALAAVGAGLGLAGALVAARALAGFLFGVSPADPVGFVAIALLLLATAALASYIPARRATRVDPMVALRRE